MTHTPRLLVAHDAGGAEVLAAWAARYASDQDHLLIEGPAIKVFQSRWSGRGQRVARDAVIGGKTKYSLVLTGTSWSSDLEKQIIRWANSQNLESHSFLEHWVNYRPRFLINDELHLPTKIIVFDEEAERIARREFPDTQIEVQENPYWTETARRIQSFGKVRESAVGVRVLYVTQPIEDVAQRLTGDKMGYGYSEFQALDQFLSWLQAANVPIATLRIRQHPSEEPAKYLRYVEWGKISGLPIELSPGEDLEKDLGWAEWVVGCDTMPMVLGLQAARRVLCTIPAGGRPLGIPLPGIERLFS